MHHINVETEAQGDEGASSGACQGDSKAMVSFRVLSRMKMPSSLVTF